MQSSTATKCNIHIYGVLNARAILGIHCPKYTKFNSETMLSAPSKYIVYVGIEQCCRVEFELALTLYRLSTNFITSSVSIASN